jgi:hypothetical protein
LPSDGKVRLTKPADRARSLRRCRRSEGLAMSFGELSSGKYRARVLAGVAMVT